MWFDTVIKNGRVLDGAGNPWFRADVGIKNGRIARIGNLGSAKAVRTIDVDGQVVAPGFIDIHNHSDFSMLVSPQMESKVRQGVTTEVNGNCGISAAPMNENVKRFQKLLGEVMPEKEMNWTTMAEYLGRLEARGVSQNVVTLVGHGTLRYYVMGDERRICTEAELEEMKRLVGVAMEDGALGLSTGLTYAPGYYAHTSEVIELAKVAAEYGGIYTSHIREWGSEVLGWSGEQGSNLQGAAEAIEVGRRSGVRATVISHYQAHRLNVLDPEQYNKGRRLIESAREEGLDVVADTLPDERDSVRPLHYSVIPPPYLVDGVESMVKTLRNPEARAKLKRDLETKTPADLGFNYHVMNLLYLRQGKADNILIYPPFNGHLRHREYEGKTLDQIAKMKRKDIFDTLLDLIVEEEGNIYASPKTMDIDVKMSQLTWPVTMVSSDGGSIARAGSLATARERPSAWGAFPKSLAWVREKKIVALEDVVRRMTSFPARTIELKDRGLLKQGFWADVTVFDPGRVKEMCTFENDARPEYPVGISYVLVNGKFVVEDGQHTGALPGKVLRHPF